MPAKHVSLDTYDLSEGSYFSFDRFNIFKPKIVICFIVGSHQWTHHTVKSPLVDSPLWNIPESYV